MTSSTSPILLLLYLLSSSYFVSCKFAHHSNINEQQVALPQEKMPEDNSVRNENNVPLSSAGQDPANNEPETNDQNTPLNTNNEAENSTKPESDTSDLEKEHVKEMLNKENNATMNNEPLDDDGPQRTPEQGIQDQDNNLTEEDIEEHVKEMLNKENNATMNNEPLDDDGPQRTPEQGIQDQDNNLTEEDIEDDDKEDMNDKEPTYGPKVEDALENTSTMLEILDILSGRNAFKIVPNRNSAGPKDAKKRLLLNYRFLKTNGGEPGQKLLDLIKEDKQALLDEKTGKPTKSDAYILRDGVISFKLGLKDNAEVLEKQWNDDGKKDEKLGGLLTQIREAFGKIQELVEKFDEAIPAAEKPEKVMQVKSGEEKKKKDDEEENDENTNDDIGNLE